MLKAVIFDMDGVIIDSEPLHYDFEQSFFEQLNIKLEKAYHNSFVGTTSHFMWQSVKDKFKLLQTTEELVEACRSGFMEYLKQTEALVLVPEVQELIQNLYKNNIKMSVASSSPYDMISFIMDKFQLRKYFSELVTGDFVENSKPAPDIFLYAAKLMNVKPDECIVIEDSHNGVLAAKAAGIKCIGYRNPNSGNQDISMADMIIDSFQEIDTDILTELLKG